MKSKGKRIGVIVLALLLLICGGIYTISLLHPERFIALVAVIHDIGYRNL
ncbi:hypothetical protein EDD76_12230 [Kineothrix alysoides]|uniref:Uncharacterized protein n=1 Tax=Kineothrix alysoides TaxID=1469948 RepID=A0A4R1QMF8_9FIRM|nr:hypothetical protein [Kineothrix alysoides]TCL54113.1 hypothetical protein EDD76_12230 [Kineothrix alysoides]